MPVRPSIRTIACKVLCERVFGFSFRIGKGKRSFCPFIEKVDDNYDKIEQVATVSANNDPEIKTRN